MRFNDWLLKYKLFGIFFTMSLLLLLIVLTAHHVHLAMTENMQIMYSQRLMSTHLLTSTYSHIKDIEVATQTIILGPLNRVAQNALVLKNAEKMRQMDELLGEYEKTQTDALSLSWLGNVREELSAFRISQKISVDLALSGNQSDAYQYYMDHVIIHVDNLNAIMNMMVKRSDEIARLQNETNQKLSDMSLWMIAILSITSVFLAFSFSKLLNRLIVVPLFEILREVKKVAGGNLQGLADYVPVDSKDEIGQLSRGVHQMSLALQQYLITAEEQRQKIFSLVFLDPLTNLPNRRQFIAKISELLSERSVSEKEFAVLFIDINHFKEINDTLGHSAGDELLRILGNRLTKNVAHADLVARIGGDEFTAVFSDYLDRSQLEAYLGNVMNIFQEPFVLEDREIKVGASIGISEFPRDGRDIDSLIKAADAAMFHAKHKGQTTLEFCTQAMPDGVKREGR